ncbi:helix-turn-helix domain-containing protein [Desulfonatronovibrio hydrogenovorans]|uniref:helix-turn-helix domain-containing protein n=1 Tax=Desulfonatronovibrio hydrogenovorans TaxID=53245 RepID=UPI000490BD43|nr:helix-turn-helix domain-containing protein [Desulfonatronovibrio hydrogenovorans]
MKVSDKDLLSTRVLLRPDEVARILRLSKKSVYRLARTGQIKPTSDTPVRYTARSVRAYINSQTGDEIL